jgi:hypothetical protein
MNDQSTWTVTAIDFANEPKEYVRWLDVPPVERLRAVRELTETLYALQRRVRRDFQPVVEVIKR